jgi:hypothetical protein
MALIKKSAPQTERGVITSLSQKRPYGARVKFQVLTDHTYKALEQVTLLFPEGTVAKVKSLEAAPWEGGQRYQIEVEGFAKASLAEAAAKKVSQALLLTAVALDQGLRLTYTSHEAGEVFERFRSDGLSMRGYGVQAWPAETVLDSLHAAMECPEMPAPTLLSLELYCAAVLEANPRAKFIEVVSALEPLANPQSLGDAVGRFVVSVQSNHLESLLGA